VTGLVLEGMLLGSVVSSWSRTRLVPPPLLLLVLSLDRSEVRKKMTLLSREKILKERMGLNGDQEDRNVVWLILW